ARRRTQVERPGAEPGLQHALEPRARPRTAAAIPGRTKRPGSRRERALSRNAVDLARIELVALRGEHRERRRQVSRLPVRLGNAVEEEGGGDRLADPDERD